MRRVIMWSGGKDSTVLLIKALEEGLAFNEFVFSDTFQEFPKMYEYIEKVLNYIKENFPDNKAQFVRVGKEGTYEKWSEGKFTRGKYKGMVRGFPLQRKMSYCTRELKSYPINRYLKDKEFIKLIGYATNENNGNRRKKIEKYKVEGIVGDEIYPLIDWNMSENDCIEFLKERGLHNSLYDEFNRLGCWFCPKQSEKSLKVLINNYPELWEKIKEKEKMFIKNDSPFALYKQEGTKYYEDKLKGE